MEKDNPRLKMLNLLKWSSTAFVDTYKKTGSERDAVAASNVYLDEILTLPANPVKMQHSQESGLKIENFLPLLNKKEVEQLPTDDQIKNLFNPNEEPLDFTSEFNEIFAENKKKKLSQDSNPEVHSPLKKAKTDEIILSPPLEDPFTSQSTEFSASTQMELDKIFNDDLSMNEYRPSPWKSDKIKTTTTSKFKNLNRRKIDAEIEENVPTTSKESIANNFAKAFVLNSSFSSQQSMKKPAAPTSMFSNPWSTKKQVEKIERTSSTTQQQTKPALTSMFLNPWSSKKPQNEKKEKPNFASIGRNPFEMSKKLSQSPASQVPSTKDNPYDLVKKQEKRNDFFSSAKKPEVIVDEPPIDNGKKDPFSSFSTARQQLVNNEQANSNRIGLSKKSVMNQHSSRTNNDQEVNPLKKKFCVPLKENMAKENINGDDSDDLNHPSLKGIDMKLLKRIKGEVVVQNKTIDWNDIAGLEEAKNTIFLRVIAPILNPKMFLKGMANKARAILLFGPPGNGKTMIGRCMASQIDATFMSISSSSLTSKWIGESETMVKALFAYARSKKRTIIFFDEIDSMLGRRNDDSSGGSETMNRFKTEFLVQLDGINEMTDEENVLLIGATNRPESLDEAILRRFQARVLIPLPDIYARQQLIKNLLVSSEEKHSLTDDDLTTIANKTEGYSGADIKILASSASFRVVRKYIKSHGMDAPAENRPPTSLKDFLAVLKSTHPTVAKATIDSLVEWNKKFGAGLDDEIDNSDIDDDD